MLILTRKIVQQILMQNGTIKMKVLKVNDDVISIGIHAPDDIDVDREEIYLKKLQQKKAEL